MTTALEEFTTNGNSKTYVAPAHTVVKPRVVVQKRKVPVEPGNVAEDTINVVFGTEDADGAPLASKVSFNLTYKRHRDALAADVAAAKSLFLEIVNSDEFSDTMAGQTFLQ
jgi:hypothetical protein